VGSGGTAIVCLDPGRRAAGEPGGSGHRGFRLEPERPVPRHGHGPGCAGRMVQPTELHRLRGERLQPGRADVDPDFRRMDDLADAVFGRHRRLGIRQCCAGRVSAPAGRSSVHVEGSDNTVRQILVKDGGWNWTNNAAIDTVSCVRATVENCTILRTSGTGLTMGPASRFLRNLVDTTSIDFEDNGDVGAWSMDGQGSEVAYNEILGNHSRWGAGIYLDAGTKNFYVHDNYVHDVQWNGINITGPLRVEHNTFVAVQHQGLGVIPQSSTDGSTCPRASWRTIWRRSRSRSTWRSASLCRWFLKAQVSGTSIPLAPGPRRVEILCSQIVQPGLEPAGGSPRPVSRKLRCFQLRISGHLLHLFHRGLAPPADGWDR